MRREEFHGYRGRNAEGQGLSVHRGSDHRPPGPAATPITGRSEGLTPEGTHLTRGIVRTAWPDTGHRPRRACVWGGDV